MPKLSGIAQYTKFFGKEEDLPPPKKFETPKERKERLVREKAEKHKKVLAEREKRWDPHNNDNATKDPYKTLFVARLSYELTEDDLREEFSRFGRIRDVKLILDTETGKSRGYAFIEFERSNDLKGIAIMTPVIMILSLKIPLYFLYRFSLCILSLFPVISGYDGLQCIACSQMSQCSDNDIMRYPLCPIYNSLTHHLAL